MFNRTGNAGIGSRWEKWDINRFNLPFLSARTLQRLTDNSYTTQSGVIVAFLKLANTAEVVTLADTESLKVVLVVDLLDGMQIKPGCQIDQITKELVGSTEKIDVEFVKQNSSLEPLKLKNNLVTEAVVGVVTTIDGKLTLPCSVYYESNKKNYAEQHKKTLKRVFQLQVCDGCLPHLTYDNGVITCSIDDVKQICMSECEECKINICDNCNNLGHTHTDPAF